MGENSMSITITAVRNPLRRTIKYLGEDKEVIECEIQCDKFGTEWLPFGASDYDAESHGKKLWKELNDGVHGEIGTWTASTPENKSKL